MSDFKTKHLGLASFLRYAGIPHIGTVRLFQKAYQFIFDDAEDQCRTLEYDFFSGCAVADAMALLESDKALKQTIKAASDSGTWQAE